MSTSGEHSYLLRLARIWSADDAAPRSGMTVLVSGNRIAAVEAAEKLTTPENAKIIDLPDATLLPGLIDAHSHLFLHPYNETPWDDQVLKHSEAYRTVRAVRHAASTLRSGFTA